jgi:hypothetical protein
MVQTIHASNAKCYFFCHDGRVLFLTLLSVFLFLLQKKYQCNDQYCYDSDSKVILLKTQFRIIGSGIGETGYNRQIDQ